MRFAHARCAHGHRYTPENTYQSPAMVAAGVRRCRQCHRDASTRYYQWKAAAANAAARDKEA
jgi:hypothetical protein